jgi:hypothetical protein
MLRDESKNRFALAAQIFNQCLSDSQLVSTTTPDTHHEVTRKDSLEK